MLIKICGITDHSIAKIADDNGCNFLGGVFYDKSPRHLEIEQAKAVFKAVKNAQKVAVVVNPSQQYLQQIISHFQPDFIQFHGHENRQFIADFKENYPKTKIIKAFSIESKSDLLAIEQFNDLTDFYLLDGKNPGTGQVFDWSILQDFKSNKPWFLAGGLTLENINQAVRITNAPMIDISSGLEKIKGIKDQELVLALLNKFNNNKNNS